MSACARLEPLLALHATGALDAGEASEVEAHLAACAACRAEAAAFAEALSLARLPPVSEAERRTLHDLPARTLEALHRRDRWRGAWKRVLVGAAAAAAAALVVLAPAVLRRDTSVRPEGLVSVRTEPVEGRTVSPAAMQSRWEGPDLDGLWDDAVVVEDGTSARSRGEAFDAALAALEAGEGR